ncbi:MAG: UvrD-helicase domain-containing protein [Frankiaceae bacterium]
MSAQPVAGPLRPAELRELLGIPFTDEQLAAATAPLLPTLVVAGAGSGKTSVMAARVVWLVATGQVAPDGVLGLTFTNKAAGELAARVRAALAMLRGGAPGGEPDGEPTVATYHAYAGRLLRDHGLRIGVEPSARLLADAARYQLAQRVVRRAPGPFVALLRAVSTVVDDVAALEAELSEHLVEPAGLRAHDERLVAVVQALLTDAGAGTAGAAKDLAKVADAARARLELLSLVEGFREAKRAADALDFGDQVALAARLAEQCPDVGAAERAQHAVVLLDEYQDTSVAQRRMLVALYAGHPVTAVGDPCQAIYGWRGASVGNLDGFPGHFAGDGAPAGAWPLRINQRSGGTLLRLANRIADPLRAVHPRVVELAARPGAEASGTARCALLPTWADEVAWVTGRIKAAVEAGTRPGQCAVLVRARSAFADLHDALAGAGLPVEVVGLGGLLALPEVADIVAVLEVLDDPTANPAMLRLLTGPRWRIGTRDLVALGQLAAALARPEEPAADAAPDPDVALEHAVAGVDPTEVAALADALGEVARHADRFSPEAVTRLSALDRELRALRRHVGEPLLELVHRVLDATGLAVELAASAEAIAAGRAEAVGAFLDHVVGFTGLDGGTSLGALLAYLRAAQQYDDGLDVDTSGGSSGRDAVQLLTVHKAKGLEWDVVAVPGLTLGAFPSGRSRPSWLASPRVLPYPLRGDAADLPAAPDWSAAGLEAFAGAQAEHAEREERRLAYVALTRARHALLASGHWWGPTQKERRGPSPYLEQVRAHCAAGLGVVEAWADAPADDAVNPQLAEQRLVAWPAPYEPTALARRRAAAELVREELAAIAAGRPSDPDAGLDMLEASVTAAWDADTEALLAELADDERRHVVRLPAALSASQLVRLAADPAGLARDIARPMPRPPAPAARRGTEFHAWVESLFGVRPLLEPDDLPGAGDAGIGDDAELEALKAAFLATSYAMRPPVRIEAPFELVLAGRVVRGRIDAVYAEPDGRYEVVDWKTGRDPADPLQLAIYRVAWAEIAGVPVDAVTAAFLHVRTAEVVRPDGLPGRAALERLLTGEPPEVAADRRR